MEMANLAGMLENLIKLKQQILLLEEEKAELEKAIIEFLPEQSKTIDFETSDNEAYKATAVYGSTVSFDIPSLKDELGPEMWGKVTVVVLDKKLLEDAVAREIIPLEVVARNSIEKPSKPYIRISKVVSSRGKS